ncbi:platelet-activating factor acetylhydrolase [Cristinia sonorae]|uniref:Putative phospholipase n=1 Tax=Cristinia sonorae TaxID=1940300 RepID=A0A8K0UX39_9AGAR|nr:platelet-activating factor acetylhydrolase [Cristinia sonorae]
MWTLADVPGRYPVGATTFATPISNDGHVIGKSKLIAGASSGGKPHAPALLLKEVVVTAYYPADTSHNETKKGMAWLTSPAKEMLRGYTKFAGMSFFVWYWLLGGIASRIKIPVFPNATLLSPSEGSRKSWPVVFFSHGLGGTRTNYSHYCSRLASQGNVVLAIEHHDGSSPFTMARTPAPGQRTSFTPEYKYYLNPEHVYWDDPSVLEGDKLALRTEQLLFRRLEVYLVYSRFKTLVQKQASNLADELDCHEWHTIDGPWNFKLEQRRYDAAFWKSWMSEEHPKIEFDENVHLTGHSFGGATVLDILSNPPPSFPGVEEFTPLPVSRGIVLDPWLEPLPSPGPGPWRVEDSLNKTPRPIPRLLLLNSEGFTLWEDHFAKLKEFVQVWKQSHSGDDEQSTGEPRVRLISIIRAKHMSFSDVGILFPNGLNPWGQKTSESQTFLDVITDLSSAFLESVEDFARVLGRVRVREETVESVHVSKKDKATVWDKKFVGDAGDVIIHV